MKIELERYIDDLEERIDPVQEERLQNDWKAWMNHENRGEFAPAPRRGRPSGLDWPHVNINDTLDDPDLSVYAELCRVNNTISRDGIYIPRMRPNYGVGIMASAFGAPLFVMPYECDTLPNVQKIGGEAVKKAAEGPMPSLTDGLLGKVDVAARKYLELRRTHPNIARFVRVEQPDLQGPIDTLELLWGSDLFYALYDEPDAVHLAMFMLTEFFDRYFEYWLTLFPGNRGTASYFRMMEKGCVTLRNDSGMNLSPDFYSEFIAPYDGRLLKKYGGIVHSCGRIDHFVDRLAGLEGLAGINMSQPEYNDMEKIFLNTVDRGIHLTISSKRFPVNGHRTENLLFLE